MFCQGNNIYQNYITYTCNNAGTSSSYCTSATTAQLQTTCTGAQTCSNGSCTNNCTSNYQARCSGNYLYWYDSCGNQQSSIQYCSNGCYNNACQNNNYNYNNCTSNYQARCSGNYLYWYDSCGNQQNLIQYCSSGCYNNTCQNNNNYNYNYNNNTCSYHSYESCIGNNLYWYDSCGTQQDLARYCSNGCYNNACQNYNNNYNYNNYSACTYHAYKGCSGSNIYWYDSCGTQQDLYSSCVSGQVCQYGQCVTGAQINVQPANSSYAAHYTTACYGNSIYWHDSLGTLSGLYKSCADNNSCTLDACSGDKCSNTLKCDGSTCASGSADYNTYCLSAQPGPITPVSTPIPTPASAPAAPSGLSISFFAKQDPNSTQWQKTTRVGSNSTVYFMATITNNSAAQIDNVNFSANIPGAISSLGNLQLNGVAVSGDIVSGINIGSIAPSSTKPITFEGKTQTISTASAEQATATSSVSGAKFSDSVLINLNPGQAAAAVSNSPATSGFSEFLKRWYGWILAGLVLVFLFVVVFKRLSSEA